MLVNINFYTLFQSVALHLGDQSLQLFDQLFQLPVTAALASKPVAGSG